MKQAFLSLILGASISIGALAQNSSKLNELYTLLWQNNYNEVLTNCELILKKNNNPEVFYIKGLAQKALLKLEDSKSSFKKAISLDPENLNYSQALADVLYQLQDNKKALALYSELNENSSNTYFELQMAKIHQREDNYTNAIELYKSLLVNDTSNYYYHKQIAICYQKNKLLVEALNHYNAAFALNNSDLNLVPVICNIYLKGGEFNKVISVCDIGLETDSTKASLHRFKAYAQFLSHKYQDAEQSFKKSISFGDTSVFNYKYLGLNYYQQENFAHAIEALEKAIELDEKDIELHYFLGFAYSYDYRKNEGREYLLKTMEMMQPDKQDMVDILKQLSEIEFYYGNIEGLEHHLAEMMRISPETKYPYYKLGRLYDYHYDDPKKALEYYQMYLELNNYTAEEAEADNPLESGFMTATYYTYKRVQEIKKVLHFKDELEIADTSAK